MRNSTPGDATQVELAEVPFLRLREVAPFSADWEADTDRLLAAVQARLDASAPPRLDFEDVPGGVAVTVGGVRVPCRRPDAVLWRGFAARRLLCPGCDKDDCYACSAHPESLPLNWGRWVDRADPKGTAADLRIAISRIRQAMREAGLPPAWVRQASVVGTGKWGVRHYGLRLAANAIAIRTTEDLHTLANGFPKREPRTAERSGAEGEAAAGVNIEGASRGDAS